MVLALAAAIGSLTLIAYLGVRRSLSSNIDEALVRESDAYSAAMRGAPTGQALIDATRVYLGARTEVGLGPAPILAVMFSRNHVISNSEVRLEGAAGNAAAREPTSAVAGLRTLKLRGTQYRVLSSPVMTSKGDQIGLFQAALQTTQAERVATQVAATLGVTGVIVLLFGAGLSLWAARRSLAPLRSMAEDAAAITHATPGTHIEYDGPPDELGTLADSLNSMLDRLEGAFGEQRRFVADASHELRTPLAIIRGNTELLISGKTTGADADEAMKMIDDEARRMTRLVEDLLALARLQGARERPSQLIEVSAMLFEAATRTRSLGDRDVSIDCPANVWVCGDVDLLDQALLEHHAQRIRAHRARAGASNWAAPCEDAPSPSRSPMTARESPPRMSRGSSIGSIEGTGHVLQTAPEAASVSRSRNG